MSLEKTITLLTAKDLKDVPPGVLLDTLQLMARDSGAGDVRSLILSATGEHTVAMEDGSATRGLFHPFRLLGNGEAIAVEAFGARRANLHVSFGELQRILYNFITPDPEILRRIKFN